VAEVDQLEAEIGEIQSWIRQQERTAYVKSRESYAWWDGLLWGFTAGLGAALLWLLLIRTR